MHDLAGSKFFVVKLIHAEFIVKRLDVTQLEVRDSENVQYPNIFKVSLLRAQDIFGCRGCLGNNQKDKETNM